VGQRIGHRHGVDHQRDLVASMGTDSVFTPKYLLKYQPNSNLDVYADIAKGLSSGFRRDAATADFLRDRVSSGRSDACRLELLQTGFALEL